MPSRRRSPFDELDELFDRLSREFGELGEEFTATSPAQPRADVEDTGDKFVVSVDLPGYDKDDIEIELRDETLHIEAEREEESEDVKERYLTRERRRGTLRRDITFPEPVDKEAVSASFENGVLEVDLPKARTGEEGTNIDIK